MFSRSLSTPLPVWERGGPVPQYRAGVRGSRDI